MGIPSLFKYLTEKYPYIISDAKEDRPQSVKQEDGTFLLQEVDATKPNPNSMEFDNFYIDMNGIIHPCCHPEDEPQPETEEQMIQNILDYVDRLFKIVRPRRVLYLAIDGPAPRAKMNQQRSRRFRSARDARKKKEMEQKLRDELIASGFEWEEEVKESWDSNVITPGTPFMRKVSECLEYFVHYKMSTDPAWKHIKVVISDANAPGEGEHKIMDFIRAQRTDPHYDPNIKHVIHGLDADLIMLTLATHEPHFTIMRETVNAKGKRGSDEVDLSKPIYDRKPFQFLHVNILREYLEREFSVLQTLKDYNFERIIDDFVFICFFVGNDFLPHLPSLDIKEGAVDLLLKLYTEFRPTWNSYITTNGNVNIDICEKLLAQLGKYEDAILQNRIRKQKIFEDRKKRERVVETNDPEHPVDLIKLEADGANKLAAKRLRDELLKSTAPSASETSDVEPEHKRRRVSEEKKEEDEKRVDIMAAVPKLEEKPKVEEEAPKKVNFKEELDKRMQTSNKVDEALHPDKVRFDEEGWKKRYYESKFEIKSDDPKAKEIRDIVKNYIQGLIWVMSYYYQGCVSWNWYYHYHYAPIASDLIDLKEFDDLFFEEQHLGTPFKPFDQLMAVFPPESGHAIPECFRNLMTDSESSILHFYPKDFKIDLDGKKFEWQGVALLPFINETELKDATSKLEHLLTEDEKKRNSFSTPLLYVHQSSAAAEEVLKLYQSENASTVIQFSMEHHGIIGTGRVSTTYKPLDSVVNCPYPLENADPVQQNKVLCCEYLLPDPPKPHYPFLLKRVKMPERKLIQLEKELGTNNYYSYFDRFMGNRHNRMGQFQTAFDQRVQQQYQQQYRQQQPYSQQQRQYNNTNNTYQDRNKYDRNYNNTENRSYQQRNQYNSQGTNSTNRYNNNNNRATTTAYNNASNPYAQQPQQQQSYYSNPYAAAQQQQHTGYYYNQQQQQYYNPQQAYYYGAANPYQYSQQPQQQQMYGYSYLTPQQQIAYAATGQQPQQQVYGSGQIASQLQQQANTSGAALLPMPTIAQPNTLPPSSQSNVGYNNYYNSTTQQQPPK